MSVRGTRRSVFQQTPVRSARTTLFAPDRLVGFFAQKNYRGHKLLRGMGRRGVENHRAAWAFVTPRLKKTTCVMQARNRRGTKKNHCGDSTCCLPPPMRFDAMDTGRNNLAHRRSVAKFVAGRMGVCIFLTVSRGLRESSVKGSPSSSSGMRTADRV